MTMQRITGLIIAAIVLALGWFLLSPLFIHVEVDEPLSLTNDNGAFDLDGVLEMPPEKRATMREEIMASAAGVTDSGFVNLGKLKGNIGNQNSVLSPDVLAWDYRSVVIWRALFGVLFSPASLEKQI